MPEATSNSSIRATAAAILLTTLGIMPVFMLGSMSPFIAGELDMDIPGLGTAVAAFFLVSAIVSAPIGRLVERMGSTRSGILAGSVSVVSMLVIAVLVSDFAVLLVVIAIAGSGNAIAQLSSNLLVSKRVVADRQGLAYGIKQAAIPAATLLGGLSVLVFALGPGWRWAFVLAPIILLLWALLVPSGTVRTQIADADPASEQTNKAIVTPALLTLALAAGLGAAAANAMGAFFVTSAVNSEVGAGDAGMLLILGSALGIATRIGVGWRADHMRTERLKVVAGMMLGGAVAMLLLASAAGPFLAIGIALGYMAGWGWTGLMNFHVVRSYPESPAAATGLTQAGVYLGAVVGPFVFGIVANDISFVAAWVGASLSLLLAATLILMRPRLGLVRSTEAATKVST